MRGALRKIKTNKWESVKVSITLSFLHKLIKLHNLVNEGHKDDLRLAIFEYCVYQNKNSLCKQINIKVKLNGMLSNHLITALGIPRSHQEGMGVAHRSYH